MEFFDLVFIVLFLTATVSLLTAAWFAIRRQFDKARRVLIRLFVAAAAYLAIAIAVSLVLPRRILHAGDRECFDDWCMSLDGFHRVPEGGRVRYSVDVRLSSRARRVAQRERNVAVYLTDNRGRRYNPVQAVPFDVLLQPQESVVVTCSFFLPPDAAGVDAVLTHEGGFPIGWFIIGYDTWFRKPPIVKLQ